MLNVYPTCCYEEQGCVELHTKRQFDSKGAEHLLESDLTV